MTITSTDPLQPGYTYGCPAGIGQNFAPEFQPDLTPAAMLAAGVFGGCYFDGVPEEFPAAWFEGARLSPGEPDPLLNFYKVAASQPLSVWQAKGWIYPEDPRGWFQLYCRYYLGRRIPLEDERQIKRWKAIRRHLGGLRKNCRPGDQACRP